MTTSTGHPDLGEYWKGLAEGQLRAQYSFASERYWWPPRAACPRTQSSDYEWRPLPATGHLFTWTVINNSPLPEFSGRPPYAVGIIEFADLQIRMVGFLDVDPDSLKIGMIMRWKIFMNAEGELRVRWAAAESAQNE